jgi:hypothetical protein
MSQTTQHVIDDRAISINFACKNKTFAPSSGVYFMNVTVRKTDPRSKGYGSRAVSLDWKAGLSGRG